MKDYLFLAAGIVFLSFVSVFGAVVNDKNNIYLIDESTDAGKSYKLSDALDVKEGAILNGLVDENDPRKVNEESELKELFKSKPSKEFHPVDTREEQLLRKEKYLKHDSHVETLTGKTLRARQKSTIKKPYFHGVPNRKVDDIR